MAMSVGWNSFHLLTFILDINPTFSHSLIPFFPLFSLMIMSSHDKDEAKRTVTCPQSWRGLQLVPSFPTALSVSLQSSLLRVAFAVPSQCSPLEFFVPGAFLSLLELSSLPQSFTVFPGVLQSLLEFLLVHQSSCYFLRAPFPRSSSEILHEASPVFWELSYYFLWCCYHIIVRNMVFF